MVQMGLGQTTIGTLPQVMAAHGLREGRLDPSPLGILVLEGRGTLLLTALLQGQSDGLRRQRQAAPLLRAAGTVSPQGTGLTARTCKEDGDGGLATLVGTGFPVL